MTDVQQQAARNAQSKKSKANTLDLLKSKKRAETTFSIYIDADGEKQEVELTYRAIGMNDYDKLVAKHPPKAEQRAEGASFNMETFAPALIAAVCVEPEMEEADAVEIWNSPDWSRGDLLVLFGNAVDINNKGMDIPFNVNG